MNALAGLPPSVSAESAWLAESAWPAASACEAASACPAASACAALGGDSPLLDVLAVDQGRGGHAGPAEGEEERERRDDVGVGDAMHGAAQHLLAAARRPWGLSANSAG